MDDLERLVAQFDADITKYEKAMTKMGVAFEKQAQAIEKRNSTLISKMNAGWDGFKGLKRALEVGVIYEAAEGLAGLVTSSLDAAKAIGVTARNAGVGVETLQKLRYASSQTGGSFELMDEALITFNKNFGQFVNDGKGKA